jgi:hypothetical protein
VVGILFAFLNGFKCFCQYLFQEECIDDGKSISNPLTYTVAITFWCIWLCMDCKEVGRVFCLRELAEKGWLWSEPIAVF